MRCTRRRRRMGLCGMTRPPRPPIHDADQCYLDHSNITERLDIYTKDNWWTQRLGGFRYFLDREPFRPLDGIDTAIGSSMYTFDSASRILKMTVLFPPLYPQESKSAELIVMESSSVVVDTAACEIWPKIWHCLFRIENLNPNVEYHYEIRYRPQDDDDSILYTWDGRIPVAKNDNPISLAVISCMGPDGYADKDSLVDAILQQNPDILLLNGDQTYRHRFIVGGFFHAMYMLRELTRNIPTLMQMDDHDYGQRNMWGADDTNNDESGRGFLFPTCYVNLLQRLYLSHNPDPIDDNDVLDNGVTIHYTNYRYGQRYDFALLEARKFKNDFRYSFQNGANSLLGTAQETWLRDTWCKQQQNTIKIVLTQTPFAGLATHGTSMPNDRSNIIPFGPDADFNGSPVSGRNRALNIFKDCSPLILSGDQHLAIAVSYSDYDDIVECTSPSSSNSIWWRLNKRRIGRTHRDPFGNMYSLKAVWNVSDHILDTYRRPGNTTTISEEMKEQRADGFLLVRFTTDNNNKQQAICEARTFRHTQQIKWSVPVSLWSPLEKQHLQTPTSPTDACYLNDTRMYRKETWTALKNWTTANRPPRAANWIERDPWNPIPGDDTVIAAVLFTNNNNGVLKMSVLFPPLHIGQESNRVELELTSQSTGQKWTMTSEIAWNIWHASFRKDNVHEAYAYRVRYTPNPTFSVGYVYDGIIPAVNNDNPTIVVLSSFGTDDDEDINKDALVSAVLAQQPDLIVFAGDNTGERYRIGYGFLETMYALNNITRSIPTIVQMGQNDYGESIYYGAGTSDDYNSGEGFTKRPVCFINLMQRLMMSHNPDPATTTATLENGITIHYASYDYGSSYTFAILESRKFKSRNGNGIHLLGDSQEAWLRNWCNTNTDKTRIVLTQSPFADVAKYISTNNAPETINDKGQRTTSAWPTAARDRIVDDILRDCSSLIISGDQNFAVAMSHGNGVSECAAPAAVNTQTWRWNNNTLGQTYTDPFDNEYTLHQAWNVDPQVLAEFPCPGDAKGQTNNNDIENLRADGFLVVRLTESEATCEAHGYRIPSAVWSHTVVLS